MRSKTVFYIITGIFAAVCFLTPNHSQCSSINEYEIKAAFLLNFARFVEWPSTSFADSDSPLVIGVLGNDPFGSALDNAIQNERVKGRRLVVRRSSQLSDLKGSHILFVSSSEQSRIGWIIREVSDRSILSVSDVSGFANRGGIVNFIVGDRKIGFEINIAAINKAGLKVSSQLLKLAKIV